MPEMSLLEQEQLRVLLLDTKNRVLGISMVYQGSLHTNVIRVGELFREAIRRNCASVIIAHNHPSGDATPSAEDRALTARLKQAGELIGITMLDHLVFGESGHYSFADNGW